MNNVSTDMPGPVLRKTLAGEILGCKQISELFFFGCLNTCGSIDLSQKKRGLKKCLTK